MSDAVPGPARSGLQLTLDTAVEIADRLGAETIELVGSRVTYRRRRGVPQVITGELGDWLVADGDDFWRIVKKPHYLDHAPPTAPGDTNATLDRPSAAEPTASATTGTTSTESAAAGAESLSGAPGGLSERPQPSERARERPTRAAHLPPAAWSRSALELPGI